ncbi:MAG: GerMN domain-containing protein [Syntrophothermus sp.]|uniref:Gmad2 immunoglobulin-like domain-containing protein n=1 Tax=Syntrophothermus sp. TaxID=2736299 RepID=UPI00257B2333|nr:Gmad2 immunoglobulin-like domain-containing protein [Syntrophothermus sp.]NSW83483.1 GerMN domain-containing protein [Syntrophothermus sp.]
MKNTGHKLWVLLLVLALCAVAGCAQKSTGKKSPTPTPEAPKTKEVSVAVYYLKFSAEDAYLVREVHKIKTAKDTRIAAVEELIQGTPTTPGATTVIPLGTKVLGLKVDKGLATVDFSREVLKANVGSAGEALGIQSIVNTLTEFPGIERVSFTVEGKVDEQTRDWWGHVGLYDQPFKRNISAVWEPVIWVTSPQPGDKVSSPLKVTGTARVFEATVNLRVLDKDGNKLAETHTMATAGAPERGLFEATIEFPKPSSAQGYVEVFWYSPKDGSELDKVRVPVKF